MIQRKYLGCLLVVASLLGVSVTHADWSENFDGGFQNSWILYHIDGVGQQDTSATYSANIINDNLVMTDPTTALAGGAVSGVGLVAEPFTDVRMTGIINPNNSTAQNDSSFLLARGNATTGTFYSAEISYLNSQLIIYRNDSIGVGSNLAEVDFPFLVGFGDSFYVEFDVEGDNFDARAYDSVGGNLLAQVSAVDSTYPDPGFSGILVNAQTTPDLPVYASWDDITATAIVNAPTGDFNGDSAFDCTDVDGLVADIAAGNNTATYDMTGDGSVDNADLTAWLAAAGAVNNASGNPHLIGDMNLDSVVDASDFNIWNGNKFTNEAAWCAGDVNADGAVDGSDFNLWNGTKFTSADNTSVVPEPNAAVLLLVGLAGLAIRRRR